MINVKGVLYVCIVLWYLLGILQNTQRPLEFIRVSEEKEIKEQMKKPLVRGEQECRDKYVCVLIKQKKKWFHHLYAFCWLLFHLFPFLD